MKYFLAAGLVGAGAPPPGADKFQLVIDWVLWGATLLCGLAFVIIGATMAINHRRGETGEHMGRLGGAAAGCVIVGASTALAAALL